MARLEKEAEWVVKELRDHPSLALWSGDNEVDQCLAMGSGIDPSINRLTREVIPRVLERLDPFRPYLPSSPYVSPKAFAMGDNRQNSIDSRHGDVGCVPIDRILGKAVLRLYPFDQITLF